MLISPDILIDRIKLKNTIKLWKLIAIFAIGIVVFTMFPKAPISPKTGFIARISVNDVITQNIDQDILIKEIADNKMIKAVIMHIDSPGGTSYGGEALYTNLRKIAETKPLVAVLDTVAASAGYMAALAAEHIVAGHTTITGSVGVLMETADVTELTKKLGVKFETYKSGALKNTPSLFEQTSAKSREVLDESILDSYNFFINLVQTRRSLTPENIKIISDGRVVTGNQALKLGLIDQIGFEDDALKWLFDIKHIKQDLKVKDVEIEPKRHMWEEYVAKSLANITSKLLINIKYNMSMIYD